MLQTYVEVLTNKLLITSWRRVLEKLSSLKIPCILWNPKVHFCVHHGLPLDPILRHLNPALTITLYFCSAGSTQKARNMRRDLRCNMQYGKADVGTVSFKLTVYTRERQQQHDRHTGASYLQHAMWHGLPCPCGMPVPTLQPWEPVTMKRLAWNLFTCMNIHVNIMQIIRRKMLHLRRFQRKWFYQNFSAIWGYTQCSLLHSLLAP